MSYTALRNLQQAKTRRKSVTLLLHTYIPQSGKVERMRLPTTLGAFIRIHVSSSVATAIKRSGNMSHHGTVRRGDPLLTHIPLHTSAVTQNQHEPLQAVT